MTRSVTLSTVVAIGAAAIAVGTATAQQQPAGQPPANVAVMEKVKDGIYTLHGGGGTTTVFVASNGVVLVDTKVPGWGQAILEKVKAITDKPVTHIVNTHVHGDHNSNNATFPESVEVVAHQNTAAGMAKAKVYQDPANKHGLPDRTMTDRLTLLSGNDAIDLYHFGPAHTGGDVFVVFRAARVMAAGDVFMATATPGIDLANGGSGLQYGQTVAKAVSGIRNVDTIIRGHSTQVATMKDFAEYGEFMRAFEDAVRAQHKAGRSVDEALTQLKLPARFNDYFIGLSGTIDRRKDIVTAMYKELDNERASASL